MEAAVEQSSSGGGGRRKDALGVGWMKVGSRRYGIHGTNTPYSIGRLATHGWMRLYNDEMRRLWERTASGTKLKLIYQTVKLGRRGNGLFLEAYPDVYNREPNRFGELMLKLRELGFLTYVDQELIQQVIKDAIGYPIQVGTVPTALLDAAMYRPEPPPPVRVAPATKRKGSSTQATKPAARPQSAHR